MNDEHIKYLAYGIMLALREHYVKHPGPEAVHEALNALGSVAAIVLQCTGPDQAAIDFFNMAVGAELRGAMGGELISERMV